MESNDVKAIESLMRLFARALDNLYNRECDIVGNDVNERCMAAHVFSYMKNKWNQFKRLRSYQLDYEYNREGESGLPKKLYCEYVKDKKAQWHLIIPDLIVHVRGNMSGQKNLCVIEFKKFGINSSDDIVKLDEMTSQNDDCKFRYKLGLHVVFGMSLDATEFEVFINGQSNKKLQMGVGVDEFIGMVVGCVKGRENAM